MSSAVARGNLKDPPIPDLRALAPERGGSTPQRVVQGNVEKWWGVAETRKPNSGVAVRWQLLTQVDLTTGSTPSAGASARALSAVSHPSSRGNCKYPSPLLKSVARRIVDRRVLHLIKMWLDCPVEETDERGRKTRTTEARDHRRGIPQGSPLSPLLANLYMPVRVGVEEARP